MTHPLSKRERVIRQRLKNDLVHYAESCLKIRTKAGRIEPLTFNAPQRLLHEALEKQKAETGRVRALVPKGRQMGVSTYVGARFFHRVTHSKGLRAFILTHRDQATAALFEMAKRFHDNLPSPVCPQIKAANAKELTFGRLDSGYKVGTAKAAGVGRAETIQLFHGSEVAFWQRAEEHASGALQAVPAQPGTEVVLESTANGLGGLFYALCMKAMKGESDYRLCFLPWFAHEAYRQIVPAGWKPPEAWHRYGELHGLSRPQLRWAHAKNRELAAARGEDPVRPCWLFRQEYPATVEEAFQVSGEGSFIRPETVLTARRASLEVDPYAPLVIGVDVALGGGDRTWMISRKGRVAGRHLNERMDSSDSMEIAGTLARIIERLKPDRVFIDVGGGYGSGVHDRLVERGYGQVLTPVQFGARASLDAGLGGMGAAGTGGTAGGFGGAGSRDYANKRAEIWGALRDWLADPGGADIPDEDELMTHIVAPGFKLNSNDQLVLEAKEKIRARLGLSPDGGDALALTFAEPVLSQRAQEAQMAGWGRDGGHDAPMTADWDPSLV